MSTGKQAIKCFCGDYYLDHKTILDEDKVKIEEYVKWKPNLSKDDMWYLDVEERQDMYMTCDREEKGAFKCWKVAI